jgi:hypothetical protein
MFESLKQQTGTLLGMLSFHHKVFVESFFVPSFSGMMNPGSHSLSTQETWDLHWELALEMKLTTLPHHTDFKKGKLNYMLTIRDVL